MFFLFLFVRIIKWVLENCCFFFVRIKLGIWKRFGRNLEDGKYMFRVRKLKVDFVFELLCFWVSCRFFLDFVCVFGEINNILVVFFLVKV